MATTEQRSGFRLPWASDSSTDTVRDATPGSTGATPAEDGERRPEDGGDGAAAKSDGPAMAGPSTSPTDPRNLPWPSSDSPHPAATAKAPDPDQSPAERQSEAPPESEAPPAEPTRAPAAEPSRVPAAELARKPAPERHGGLAHTNPLVMGLLRVMKDAAETAREEALTSFAELAKTRAEEIRADSAGANQEIRRVSDEEIGEIREWSKAQMVLIRQEADDRIAERRRRLEADTEEHAARIERRITTVQDAVGKYETQMGAFFESLMAETDPAGLAGFAELMPDPPDLSTEGLDDDDTWAPDRTLDPAAAAAAEAAALDGLDLESIVEPADGQPTDPPPAPEASSESTEPTPEADESRVTQLSVVGLISVASIAAFKRAVSRAAGIDGVSVASGPDGEFEFTVRHAESVDLKAVVAQLEEFDATVTNQKKGVISVTASEPADPS